MGHYDGLCAFVLVYGPLFRAMCRNLVLWTFISGYVPLLTSMCLYLRLCAFISIYVPLSGSMDRHLHSMGLRVDPLYGSSPPPYEPSSAHRSFSRHPASNRWTSLTRFE